MGIENNERRPSYVPTSRGLEPYLWAYSPAACKLYEWIRIIAPWNGPNKGVVEFSLVGARDRINLSHNTIKRALLELSIGHFGDVPPERKAPPFINILEWPRGGPGAKIKIGIRKPKLTARDIHAGEAATNKNNSQRALDIIGKVASKKDMLGVI